MIALPGLLMAAFVAGAAAQQPDDEIEVRSSSAVERDGFVDVTFVEGRGTEERQIVDERLAGPVAQSLGAVDYGFSYALQDFDGDGLNDIAIAMRVAVEVPFGDGAGAPTYVYLFKDGNWVLAAHDRALSLAVRVDGDQSALAFASENGYARYTLDDGRYERTVVAE